jgi:hypothetical protein
MPEYQNAATTAMMTSQLMIISEIESAALGPG